MHSQKKMGTISNIRKPAPDFNGGISLHMGSGNASNLTNKNQNYKYMSPYSKNVNKKNTFEV